MPTAPAGDQSRRASLATLLAPLAGRVPAPLLGLAASVGRVRRLAPGERLFAAGDPVPGLHLVVAGAVRVLREAPGRNVVVHREDAGGLLGEVALFADVPYPGTAVALEPTTVVLLPSRAVRAALGASADLAALLLQRLARRTHEVIGRLDRIATRTVAHRLAAHVLERAARVRAGDAPVVTLGMTHVQLAEELGTVKEIVTRELRALARAGVLRAEGGGRYRLLDRAALARAAEGARA